MNSLVLASLSLPNLVSRLPGGVAQGIIWGIMALGVYITFRLLDVADLTVDGSFTTGGAVTVMLIIAGWPAWAALLAAGVCFFCLGGNVTLLLVALWIGAGTIPLKKSGNRACHMGWKRVQ